MRYLSRRAALAFLQTSKLSYLFGLLDWSIFLDRLVALNQMCGPNDPSGQTANRILMIEGWDTQSNWSDDNCSRQDDGGEHLTASTGSKPTGFFPIADNSDDDEIIYFFMPSINTGLSNWEFHQADDDFSPSIPHGHWNGNHQPKLDPYLGWVYKNSEQIRRVRRKDIIALWNEPDFRELARIAIEYYISHYPKYGGWRVSNPRRLPRHR
jgi:hypothetical protein